MNFADTTQMKTILEDAKVIAVIGHSDKSFRASYQIAQYLRDVGYTVYPVNPTIEQVNGEKSYASLADFPEPVDIVNVFRRSVFLPGVIDDAVAANAKHVWTQLDVFDKEAGKKAVEAGLGVVMDRCIKVEHRRLLRS